MATPILVDTLKQFMCLHVECVGNGLKHPKTDFLAAPLKVGDVVLVHPGLFGKIDLPPMPL